MPKGPDKSSFNYGDLIINKLLSDRGIDTDEKVKKFLSPSADDLTPPDLLNGMTEGAQKIREHIAKGSRILIYGDYDCDGIGAAAIMYLTLKAMGAVVQSFIPVRLEDGYGLSIESINRLFSSLNPDLVITVDCGISSHIEVAHVKSLGADIIVTDHHEPQSILPDCVIINPKLQKDYPELCGAGVALKLSEALMGREFAMGLMDICAISTIADLVPLVSDNRVIARLGLNMLTNNTRPGIKALLKAAGHKYSEPINSYDVAFKIAPRLNASGRLSTAEKSFKLLVESDPYLLSHIADELETENRMRQELCVKTIEEAKELINGFDILANRVIVLYKPDWEGGVIGIAAAKITQEYNRPSVLLTDIGGMVKGSCRSIPGVNVHEILDSCKDLLLGFGGHSMAAGLSILPQNMDKFIKRCNEYAQNNFDASLFIPRNKCDAEISLSDIDLSFAEALSRFEPYGVGNPRPVFMQRFNAAPFARIKRHNHIKLNVNRTTGIIAFNSAEYLDILCSDMEKKLYFSIEKELFNNRELIKCYLKAIEISDFSPKGEDFISYCESFLKKDINPPKKPGCKPSSIYGHLVIVFTEASFLKLSEKYPTYAKHYGIMPYVNPVNSILFAPRGEIAGLSNYGKIEVYDSPPEAFANYIKKSSSAEVITYDNPPVFGEPLFVSVNELRDTYTYIKAYADGRASGADTAYNLLTERGYTQDKRKFLLSYYIFIELGLIERDKKDIIYVKNEKVELNASGIYAAMVKNARNIA